MSFLEMFLTLLLFSSAVIAIALAAMGIKIHIKRSGKFPDTHIGRNSNMKKLGISCAKSIDVGCTPSSPGSKSDGCCCGQQ